MCKMIFGWGVSIAILFCACTNGVTSKDVAEKFLEAYARHKFDDAKKYGTEHTRKMLDVASILHKNAKKDTQAIDYEIVDCFEKDDKATVVYKLKGAENTEVIYLVKKNENWLVGLR